MHSPDINPSLTYRPEVDGLRAIAVTPVVLFHAGFPGFSGGYVGVDIFFVISGYLIGTIILRECDEGTFSIMRFYERRARRILPALFFVLAVSLPIAIATMLPWQLKEYGRSLIATVLFGSNILFWRESGYFDAAAEEKPLLHTWSLAVEEQFYIFLPIAIFVLWRFGARWTGAAIIAAAFASLILSELGWRYEAVANFYLLPTRAWELLTGVVVALWMMRQHNVASGLRAAVGSAIGLTLLIGSIFLLDDTTPFPSVYAIPPVLGTALVLMFGQNRTPVARFLRQPAFVGIGLISYSFYLWHQPIFAFSRLQTNAPPPHWIMAALSLLAAVLAYGTWRFVERPFRDRSRIGGGRIFQLSGAATACTLIAGAAIVVSRGGIFLYPDYTYDFLATSPAEYGEYVKGDYISEAQNRNIDPNKQNLIIIGDSYSQDFYNMITESGSFSNHSITAHYVPTRCQIYYGSENIDAFRSPTDRSLCQRADFDASTLERIARADVVIFSARWRPWAIERLAETLTNLPLTPEQSVFVISNKSFDPEFSRFLGADQNALASARVPMPPGLSERNNLLAQSLPSWATFIDLTSTYCDADGSCRVFTPEGRLISHDGGHLTEAGARFLGEQLFSQEPLSVYGAN